MSNMAPNCYPYVVGIEQNKPLSYLSFWFSPKLINTQIAQQHSLQILTAVEEMVIFRALYNILY